MEALSGANPGPAAAPAVLTTLLQQLAVFSQKWSGRISGCYTFQSLASSFTAASVPPNKGGKVGQCLHWHLNLTMPPGLQGVGAD